MPPAFTPVLPSRRACLLQEEAVSRRHAGKGVRKDPVHFATVSRRLDAAWEWIRRNPKVSSAHGCPPVQG